jgi:hypothetical protein
LGDALSEIGIVWVSSTKIRVEKCCHGKDTIKGVKMAKRLGMD